MRLIVMLSALALVFALVALPEGFRPRLPAVKKGTSQNWAGYAVESDFAAPAGVVTFVQGGWKVPAVRCGFLASTYSAVWVGMDGYSSPTIEQIGTGQDCPLGVASYYAW